MWSSFVSPVRSYDAPTLTNASNSADPWNVPSDAQRPRYQMSRRTLSGADPCRNMHVRAAWPHSVPAVAECLPSMGNASHGFTPPARNLRAPDNEGIGAVTLRAFASPRRRHARGAGASLRQRQGLDDAAAKICLRPPLRLDTSSR